MNPATGDQPDGDAVVLPRTSYAWRSRQGYLTLVVIVLVGAVGWFLAGDRTPAAWLTLAFGAAVWLSLVWAFKRDEDRFRLVVDDTGLSSTKGGEVVEHTDWAHVTSVEFDAGTRGVAFGVGASGMSLPSVRWSDDRPYDRWHPSAVVEVVDLPMFGRRALTDASDTLRAACDAHGVEYRAYWSWKWLLSFHRSNWHHPEPKPPRRPW